jgi:CVNH domain
MPNTIDRSLSIRRNLLLTALLWAGGTAAWGVGLPAGSYQASCKDAAVASVMPAAGPPAILELTAQCKDTSGHWIASKLVGFDHCVSDIANFNGVLRCSLGTAPPAGNYLQSCRYVFVETSTDNTGKVLATTLKAECRARNGAWRETFLRDFQKCKTQVSNFDGALQCSEGSIPSADGYAKSCRDIFTSGTTLFASCKNFAGNWVPASLANFVQCTTGTLENIDGFLTCIPGGLEAAPPGTYLRTCRNVIPPHSLPASGSSQNPVLQALCREPGGAWNPTTLPLAGCHGDITNVYGRLSCVSGGAPPPPGSYLQTCANIVSNPGTLQAMCRTEQGSFVESPTLQGCKASVSNDNGTLKCDS